MARHTKRTRQRSIIPPDKDVRIGTRDANDIANRQRLGFRKPYNPLDPWGDIAPRLSEIEDHRRHYEDLSSHTYRTITGTQAAIRPVTPRRVFPVHGVPRVRAILRERFVDARRTIVCVRRRMRREVLFALQYAGKGLRNHRPAQWSTDSKIICG